MATKVGGLYLDIRDGVIHALAQRLAHAVREGFESENYIGMKQAL